MIANCSACGNRNILKVSKKIEGKRIAFICKGKSCNQRIEVDIPLQDPIATKDRQTIVISDAYAGVSSGRLLVENQEDPRYIKLKKGVNVIGRKSPSSHADIQINVADMYMSRMHTVIVVTEDDQKTEYLLKDYDSKNNTILNGTPLHKGEEVYLVNGDRISLGQTNLRFSIK